MVFPPENVRLVSRAKDFTLAPGTYTYPFSFQIPLRNSCIKLLGVSNKVLFNSQSFDVVLNNGNFNSKYLRGVANDYLGQGGGRHFANDQVQLYHVSEQLPPSMSVNSQGTISYFLKVTVKRLSMFKANLRGHEPFKFLPLDDSYSQPPSDNEAFVRKQVVFRKRTPEIAGVTAREKGAPQVVLRLEAPAPPRRRGLLLRFLDARSGAQMQQSLTRDFHEIAAKDVPFTFEARYKYPSTFVPLQSLGLRLFLTSPLNPNSYTLREFGLPEQSNGLGVLYLQNIRVDLECLTTMSVLVNNEYIHGPRYSTYREVISLCDNSFENLRFDLKDCITSPPNFNSGNPTYELEIPSYHLSNCVIPETVCPSFKTCNISRTYNLHIVAGFSPEAESQKWFNSDVRNTELVIEDVIILSGVGAGGHRSSVQLALATNGTYSRPPDGPSSSPGAQNSPVLNNSKELPVTQPVERVQEEHIDLPTYDDAVRENIHGSGTT